MLMLLLTHMAAAAAKAQLVVIVYAASVVIQLFTVRARHAVHRAACRGCRRGEVRRRAER